MTYQTAFLARPMGMRKLPKSVREIDFLGVRGSVIMEFLSGCEEVLFLLLSTPFATVSYLKLLTVVKRVISYFVW